MPMIMKPHPVTGKLMPQVEGDYCHTCGHEIPNTDSSIWNHPTQENGDPHILAHNRTDILYMTGPSKQYSSLHLLTLHSLDGFPPHIMILLTTFLRDLARTDEGKKQLADYGIGVASTHEEN